MSAPPCWRVRQVRPAGSETCTLPLLAWATGCEYAANRRAAVVYDREGTVGLALLVDRLFFFRGADRR